jgi:putative transposase
MSHTKIWIRAVWATRNHHEFLSKSIRDELFFHMKENARNKGIEINFINRSADHVHCLVKLRCDQSISKVIQMIKGESSRWINLHKMTCKKFPRTVEYFAGSVSESAIDKVRDYIRNQEQHHEKKRFTEEYELFLERYGLKPKEKRRGSDTPD